MLNLPKGKVYAKHHLSIAPFITQKILSLPDGTTYYDKWKFVFELNRDLTANGIETLSVESLSKFIRRNASSWCSIYGGKKGYCFMLNPVTREDLKEDLRTDYIL